MVFRNVFVDSDILLDVVLIREPFINHSGGLLDLASSDAIICFTSVHSLLNVHYIAKKQLGETVARKAIQMLINKIKVVTEDVSIIQQAIPSDFSDFEDAVQHYAAINAGCDAIITRNIKDYKHATIPVLTAEEFLRTIL